MQLANSRRLIKGIQLLLNDLIWQIAILGEGGFAPYNVTFPAVLCKIHSLLYSMCRQLRVFANPILCFDTAFLMTTSCSRNLDHHRTAHLEWQINTHSPLPKITLHHSCNSLLSDSFSMMLCLLLKIHIGKT